MYIVNYDLIFSLSVWKLNREQPHNTRPLLKVTNSSGSFGSAVDKRTRKNLYGSSPCSIHLVAHLARQWMTKQQTSQMTRLVWWMIKSGPVFCSLALKEKVVFLILPASWFYDIANLMLHAYIFCHIPRCNIQIVS